MKPLVEELVGLPFDESGRLYAVINFDYVPNPKGNTVPLAAMEAGVPFVIKVLRLAEPRIVVAMDLRTCKMLARSLLERGLTLRSLHITTRLVMSERRGWRYKPIDVWKVGNPTCPFLDSAYILRLPQHPAKPWRHGLVREVAEVLHSSVPERAS